jgi:photosystem II stability/assembly factor-like uncharacterized protein
MKTLKIFLNLVLLSHLTFAQWNKVEEVISPLVFSVLFSGNNIYVGTDTLYISRNRGITWESKIIADQPIDITALIQINERLFTGTYGKGVYQSTDNGESWQLFNTGLGGIADYAKTFVVSGDTLFYGTDGGGIYYLKLNSFSWQSYNQNLPSNIAWTVNDMAVSNNNIIVSSGASGYHYLRPKGSAEWNARSISAPSGRHVTFSSLFASGDTVFGGSAAGIFRSFDNGYSWDSIGIRAMPLNAVSLIKEKDRIYAGFTRLSGNDFYIWYSDDYGDSWNFLDHQFQYLHHIYIYDSKIWATTNDGLWFKELNTTSAPPVENSLTFNLEQNFPNPFNPTTNFQFRISDFGSVSLKVYDILGKEIATLVDEEKAAGIYQVEFNASHLSSGAYFFVLHSGKYKMTKKMMVLK